MNAYDYTNDGPDADWRDDPGPPEASLPPIERFSDPLDILRAAKRLLAHEGRLVRDGERTAEDADGMFVYPEEAAACRFCLAGAIFASCDRSVYGWAGKEDVAWNLMDRACCELGYSWKNFTDTRTGQRLTVAQVQQVFALAIMLGGGTDANAPMERDTRTGMTAPEQEAARRLLNETIPGLGDHAVANIDSSRSLLRNVARGDWR